jgi:nicotinamide phosphoribosyltransferase
MNINNNLLLLTDSYKFGGHWNMLPEGTETVYSYFEARKGAKWDDVTFFGLQYVIKKHLAGVVVTREKIEQAAKVAKMHFGTDTGFNRAGWEHILNEWGGKLPVVIKAVREGVTVPVNNVLMTVQNLGGAKTAWLTGYLETVLTHIWYGSTVATQSREAKKLIKHYLDITSDGGLLDFFIHDFGCRSVSCMEQAAYGGAAHLVNFKGTDTVPALTFAEEVYGADLATLAYSVPATEHSIMTACGPEGEADIVGNLIAQYPTGILSMVGDSFNIYDFAAKICGETYREAILARDGVLVIRPDSGDPEEVMLKLADILWAKFGGTVNSKGYKVINPKVRLLWGDGINLDGVRRVLGVFDLRGWATENVACFGIGSNLLQKVNRDDLRFAFKCCAHERDGKWVDVFKSPIEGGKNSKRGRLKLVKDGDTFKTVRFEEPGEDLLVTVFEAGELVKEITFDEVRKNAAL